MLVAETTWGPIRVEIADGCVVGCELPPVGRAAANPPVLQRFHGAVRPADRDTATRAEAFLRELWAGRRAPSPACRLPPAGVFVTEVWRQLARVPLGHTVSYAALAARAGRPRAARAAGTACATNRIPLFVPCHRVLASGGRLGGFSAGLPWKRALLALEQAAARQP